MKAYSTDLFFLQCKLVFVGADLVPSAAKTNFLRGYHSRFFSDFCCVFSFTALPAQLFQGLKFESLFNSINCDH
jgi:hypothetical protein